MPPSAIFSIDIRLRFSRSNRFHEYASDYALRTATPPTRHLASYMIAWMEYTLNQCTRFSAVVWIDQSRIWWISKRKGMYRYNYPSQPVASTTKNMQRLRIEKVRLMLSAMKLSDVGKPCRICSDETKMYTI